MGQIKCWKIFSWVIVAFFPVGDQILTSDAIICSKKCSYNLFNENIHVFNTITNFSGKFPWWIENYSLSIISEKTITFRSIKICLRTEHFFILLQIFPPCCMKIILVWVYIGFYLIVFHPIISLDSQKFGLFNRLYAKNIFIFVPLMCKYLF